MAETRSKSGSKQAQHSFPRFRTIPRGVRLSAGNPFPSFRPSRTDEKNGKFVSTKSPHGLAAGGDFWLSAFAAACELLAHRNPPKTSAQNPERKKPRCARCDRMPRSLF